MAVLTLPRFAIPMPAVYSAAAPAISFIGATSTAKYQALIFQCPKAGTLDQMECVFSPTGTVVGRWSFQDVDLATGFPDLTEDQYRDITLTGASGIFTPGLMTSDGTDTGTKRTVTAGELLSVVFKQTSSLDASNNNAIVGIGQDTSAAAQFGNSGPWHGLTADATPTWTKSVVGFGPAVALKYSDGSYAPLNALWYPATVLNTHTFNSGSTPDERGARFIPVANLRCNGGWVRIDLDGNCDVILYDASNNVVATVSLDLDVRQQTSGGHVPFVWAPVTLTSGLVYRFVVKPTSVTSLSTYSFTLGNTAHLACFDTGVTWYYTERTDAGAWTDTNTQVPNMGLFFNGIDQGNGYLLVTN